MSKSILFYEHKVFLMAFFDAHKSETQIIKNKITISETERKKEKKKPQKTTAEMLKTIKTIKTIIDAHSPVLKRAVCYNIPRPKEHPKSHKSL